MVAQFKVGLSYTATGHLKKEKKEERKKEEGREGGKENTQLYLEFIFF